MFGHDLDVAGQAVVHQVLHLGGREGPGLADHRVRRVGELVLEFEADHVDLELRGPVEVALERLDAVLVVLGVPVADPQLVLRPVADRRPWAGASGPGGRG